MSYLPADIAVRRDEAAVEYFGDRYPVTVAVAGATPLFDPGERAHPRVTP